jgi:hypothetical protein
MITIFMNSGTLLKDQSSRTDSTWKQEWVGERRRWQGMGGEMAQTMYAHVNKLIKINK